MQHIQRIFYLLLIALLLLVPARQVVLAQENTPNFASGTPVILDVQTERFPEVGVTIRSACPQETGNDFNGYQLFEDTQLVQINNFSVFTDVVPNRIDTATLILLDLWQGSQSQLDAIKNELRKGMIDGAQFLDNTNDIAAIDLPQSNQISSTSLLTTSPAIDGWTTDGGALFNGLNTLLVPSIPATKLTQLLQQGIDRFAPYPNAVKRIVLFSNGYEDPPSTPEQQIALISLLRAQNITLDAIELEEGIRQFDYLRELAAATGGSTYQLPMISGEGITQSVDSPSLTAFWRSIPQVQKCRVSYRSGNPHPTSLQLWDTRGAKSTQNSEAFAHLNVPPPAIQELKVISTSVPNDDNEFAANVSFHIDLDPYPLRQITQIEYYFAKSPNHRWSQAIQPQHTYTIPIEHLELDVPYTLVVETSDELGQTGSAQTTLEGVPPASISTPLLTEVPPENNQTETKSTPSPPPTPFVISLANKIAAWEPNWLNIIVAIILTALIAIATYWCVRLLSKSEKTGLSREPSRSNTRPREPGKVPAVLYRTSFQRDILQVLPINREMFRVAASNSNDADYQLDPTLLQNNAMMIQFDNGNYILWPDPATEGGVNVKRDNEKNLRYFGPQDTNQPYPLFDGDVITIGKLEFVFYVINKPNPVRSTPEVVAASNRSPER